MKKEQAIKTAARWWRDKISKKVRHDNGDNSLTSMLAGAMADSLAEDIPEEKLDKFEVALIQEIEEFTNRFGLHAHISLGCDYGPDYMLGQAADKAEINDSCFPWKTCLLIYRNDEDKYQVRVSDGYRAPWVDLKPIQEETK